MRRAALFLVMASMGLAMIGDALIHRVPGAWVPEPLLALDRYVSTDRSLTGVILGFGFLVAALSPLRNRFLVTLGILLGLANISAQVGRDYLFHGQLQVLPTTIPWIAVTVSLILLFPTRPREEVAEPMERPLPRLSALMQARREAAEAQAEAEASGGRRSLSATAAQRNRRLLDRDEY